MHHSKINCKEEAIIKELKNLWPILTKIQERLDFSKT